MAAKRFRRTAGPRVSRKGLQNKPRNAQVEIRKAQAVLRGKGSGCPLGLQGCHEAELRRAQSTLGNVVGVSGPRGPRSRRLQRLNSFLQGETRG